MAGFGSARCVGGHRGEKQILGCAKDDRQKSKGNGKSKGISLAR